MEVKFADSFFESLQKMANRERWYWKTWDFFRYDLPNGVKNIFFFWRVIWNYRSWDSSFQMRILARSLEPLANTLEHHGNEVDEPRLKKVAKIRRAIEILNRQSEDNYIDLAEEILGYEVDLSYGIFGDKDEEEEPAEIKENNRKVYDLARELEEKEWTELWAIFNGQEHAQFITLLDKAKSENIDIGSDDCWNKWFDGSGLKGWWD
jgi:hypothetical protein